jgi:hypothetical protein
MPIFMPALSAGGKVGGKRRFSGAEICALVFCACALGASIDAAPKTLAAPTVFPSECAKSLRFIILRIHNGVIVLLIRLLILCGVEALNSLQHEDFSVNAQGFFW